MNQWKKIETAPKDGTHLLLTEKGERIVVGFHVEGEWLASDSKIPITGISDEPWPVRPTHWMSLPDLSTAVSD